MLKSMTGYGRGEATAQGMRYIVEIRSVNQRFLDVNVKVARAYLALEPRIKEVVSGAVARGRLDVFLETVAEETAAPALALNRPLLGAYLGVIDQMKSEYPLAGSVSLDTVLGLRDVVVMKELTRDQEAEWLAIQQALRQALEGLDAMRVVEGAHMGQDIAARLEVIGALMRGIEERAAGVEAQLKERFLERVTELLGQASVEDLRLGQEVVLAALRCDVTEEIVRFTSHLAQLRDFVAEGSPTGRRLEFVLQELNREVSTLASKVASFVLAKDAVEIKTHLERIREQVQNVE